MSLETEKHAAIDKTLGGHAEILTDLSDLVEDPELKTSLLAFAAALNGIVKRFDELPGMDKNVVALLAMTAEYGKEGFLKGVSALTIHMMLNGPARPSPTTDPTTTV